MLQRKQRAKNEGSNRTSRRSKASKPKAKVVADDSDSDDQRSASKVKSGRKSKATELSPLPRPVGFVESSDATIVYTPVDGDTTVRVGACLLVLLTR